MCVISIYLKCDLASWINIIAPIDVNKGVKLWGINDDITNRSGQCMMWLKLRASPILATELLTMWWVKRVWLHYWWKQARDHITRYSWADEGVRDLYLAVGSWKTWSKGLSADSIRTSKNRMKENLCRVGYRVRKLWSGPGPGWVYPTRAGKSSRCFQLFSR